MTRSKRSSCDGTAVFSWVCLALALLVLVDRGEARMIFFVDDSSSLASSEAYWVDLAESYGVQVDVRSDEWAPVEASSLELGDFALISNSVLSANVAYTGNWPIPIGTWEEALIDTRWKLSCGPVTFLPDFVVVMENTTHAMSAGFAPGEVVALLDNVGMSFGSFDLTNGALPDEVTIVASRTVAPFFATIFAYPRGLPFCGNASATTAGLRTGWPLTWSMPIGDWTADARTLAAAYLEFHMPTFALAYNGSGAVNGTAFPFSVSMVDAHGDLGIAFGAEATVTARCPSGAFVVFSGNLTAPTTDFAVVLNETGLWRIEVEARGFAKEITDPIACGTVEPTSPPSGPPLPTLPSSTLPPSLVPTLPPSLVPTLPPSLVPTLPPSLVPTLPPSSLVPTLPPGVNATNTTTFTGLGFPVVVVHFAGDGLVTSQAGQSDSFAVSLGGGGGVGPVGSVGVSVIASVTSAVSVSPAWISFGGDSWDEPVVVSVTGLRNDEAAGDVAFVVAVSVVISEDPRWEGLNDYVPGVNRFVAFPVITSVSPTVASVHGDTLTITGTGFEAPVVVHVGSVAAFVVAVEATTTIVVEIPAGAIGAKTYAGVQVANNATGARFGLDSAVYFAEACFEAGTVSDGEGGCQLCPSGATCPGGGRVWPDKGHWTPGEDAGVVINCVPAYKCVGGQNSSCADGHGAFACSECGPGMVFDDGLCVECRSDTTRLLFVLADFIVLAMVFYVVLRCSDEALQRYIFFSLMVQLVRLVGTTNAGRLPAGLFDVFRVIGIFAAETTGEEVPCTELSDMNSGGQQFMMYALWQGAAFVVALTVTTAVTAVMACVRMRHPELRRWWLFRAWTAFVGVVLASYTRVTQVALRSLVCVPVGGEYGWLLRGDMTVQCWRGAHWLVVSASLVVLATVTFGVPLCYVRLSRRRRRREAAAWKDTSSGWSGSDGMRHHQAVDGGDGMGMGSLTLSSDSVSSTSSTTTTSTTSSPIAPSRSDGPSGGQAGPTGGGGSGRGNSASGGNVSAGVAVDTDPALAGDASSEHDEEASDSADTEFGHTMTHTDLAGRLNAYDDGAGRGDGEGVMAAAFLRILEGRVGRQARWFVCGWMAFLAAQVAAIEVAMGSAIAQAIVFAVVCLVMAGTVIKFRPMVDGRQDALVCVVLAVSVYGAATVAFAVTTDLEGGPEIAATAFVIIATLVSVCCHAIYFFAIRGDQSQTEDGDGSYPLLDISMSTVSPTSSPRVGYGGLVVHQLPSWGSAGSGRKDESVLLSTIEEVLASSLSPRPVAAGLPLEAPVVASMPDTFPARAGIQRGSKCASVRSLSPAARDRASPSSRREQSRRARLAVGSKSTGTVRGSVQPPLEASVRSVALMSSVLASVSDDDDDGDLVGFS